MAVDIMLDPRALFDNHRTQIGPTDTHTQSPRVRIRQATQITKSGPSVLIIEKQQGQWGQQ